MSLPNIASGEPQSQIGASSSPFSHEISGLLKGHLTHLKDAAISLEVIYERGYESVLGKKHLADLGFSKAQQRTPGILMPLHWDNKLVGHQYRPDSPRLNPKGKPIKYETPRESSNHLDCHPRAQAQLGNPSVPLWITEGIKKGDALTSLGCCVIAITGVWNWRGRNEFGGLAALAAWESIALNNREVYVVTDSDYNNNNRVQGAVKRLARFLTSKQARVAIVVPPPQDGNKVGIDDFLATGHALDEVRSLAIGVEETHEGKELLRNYLLLKGQLVLEIQRFDGSYGFAHLNSGKIRIVPEVPYGGELVRPRPLPVSEGRPVPIVGLPDETITTCSLLEPAELYHRIKDHIARYVDLSELDLQLACFYVVFSWFYQKGSTLGYLRFLSDTGKGKSRALKVIGDLCFYPVYASGSSSFSGIARTNQRWRGTLVIDEADLAGDKEHYVVKYLNLGIEEGKYYILSDKQNPKFQEFFDPYSPKVIAMREPFQDNALEGRLLSISTHETQDPNIPILLPDEYQTEMLELRNHLALFAMHHFDKVSAAAVRDFPDLGLEPRLRQLAMPLSIVLQIWPDGAAAFRDYLVKRQSEIRRIRSLSWPGGLANLVIAIATGDHDLTEEFGGYYQPKTNQIQGITPTMVARAIGSTAKTVTQSLVGIGFYVEWRWIDYYKNDELKRKRPRCYVLNDFRTWQEILSRYWYSEDEDPPELPDVLKSKQFVDNRVQKTVPSVPTVPDECPNSPTEKIHGTDGTDGTDGTHYSTHCIESLIQFWRSQGAPLVHLGPGENCADLGKLCSNPGILPRHLEAVRNWSKDRGWEPPQKDPDAYMADKPAALDTIPYDSDGHEVVL